MFYGISLWWILLATVIYFAIGAAWYSPLMFAKTWAEEIKRKKADMTMATSAMVTTFICMLVLVTIEAYLVHATGTSGLLRGAYLGLKIWVGFVATTSLVNSSFQSGSKKLY